MSPRLLSIMHFSRMPSSPLNEFFLPSRSDRRIHDCTYESPADTLRDQLYRSAPTNNRDALDTHFRLFFRLFLRRALPPRLRGHGNDTRGFYCPCIPHAFYAFHSWRHPRAQINRIIVEMLQFPREFPTWTFRREERSRQASAFYRAETFRRCNSEKVGFYAHISLIKIRAQHRDTSLLIRAFSFAEESLCDLPIAV